MRRFQTEPPGAKFSSLKQNQIMAKVGSFRQDRPGANIFGIRYDLDGMEFKNNISDVNNNNRPTIWLGSHN